MPFQRTNVIILAVFVAVFSVCSLWFMTTQIGTVVHSFKFIYLKDTSFDNITKYIQHDVAFNKNSCVIILKQQLGRLGNLLFKFVSAYGLARFHRCKLYVEESYLQILDAIFTINIGHMSISKLQYLNLSGIIHRGNVACHYFQDLMQPNSFKYLELSGYWQAFGHFIKYTDEIRQQLTFRSEIIRQIAPFFIQLVTVYQRPPLNCSLQKREKTRIANQNTNVMSQQDLTNYLRNSAFTLVGVHWRRGDFLNKAQQDYGQTPSLIDYLNKAMSHFLDKYCNALFIVTSDDKEYCRKAFRNNSHIIITPDNFTHEQDLAALVVCQHTIVTTGSFGWFAAYLSGGDVLYDRLSPGKNTSLEKDCPPAEYYPPRFLAMKRWPWNNWNFG